MPASVEKSIEICCT